MIKFSRGDFRPEKASPVLTLSAVLILCMIMSYSFRKTKKKLTNKMCKVFPHPVTEADLLSVLFCAVFGASNVIGGVFVSDLVKRKFDILQ